MVPLQKRDSRPQGMPMAMRVWDVRKSECRAVMVRIRVETLPGMKVSPLRTGLSSQENLENRQHEEKQMTTTASLSIGASSAALTWDANDWQTIKKQVRRLQMRIAKATRKSPEDSMDRGAGSKIGLRKA